MHSCFQLHKHTHCIHTQPEVARPRPPPLISICCWPPQARSPPPGASTPAPPTVPYTNLHPVFRLEQVKPARALEIERVRPQVGVEVVGTRKLVNLPGLTAFQPAQIILVNAHPQQGDVVVHGTQDEDLVPFPALFSSLTLSCSQWWLRAHTSRPLLAGRPSLFVSDHADPPVFNPLIVRRGGGFERPVILHHTEIAGRVVLLVRGAISLALVWVVALEVLDAGIWRHSSGLGDEIGNVKGTFIEVKDPLVFRACFFVRGRCVVTVIICVLIWICLAAAW